MMKKLNYAFFIFLIALSLPFTYGGCNGGGGGDDSGTPPSISSVILYKIVDGTPTETLIFDIGDEYNVNIYASDPDLNMSTLYVSEYLLPDLDTPYYPTGETILPSQVAADMIYFLIENGVVAGPAGDWRVCFLIIDGAGNESNEFCLNIVINEGATSLSLDWAPESVFDFSNEIFEGEAVE